MPRWKTQASPSGCLRREERPTADGRRAKSPHAEVHAIAGQHAGTPSFWRRRQVWLNCHTALIWINTTTEDFGSE